MWPWPVTGRLLLCAGVALFAFAAGWSANGARLKAKADAELVKMYRAGEKVVAKRQEKVDEYVAEVAALRGRKPRVVYVPPRVPTTPGGPDAACAGEAVSRDIGPELREVAEELIRANALRESLK